MDLLKNKKLIEEKVGNTVISFAYPFGKMSDSSEELLKETGHKMMLTIKGGVNTFEDGTYLLHRINVPAGMTGKDIVDTIQDFISKKE